MPRLPLALVGLSVVLLALAACSNDEAVKTVTQTVVTPTTSEFGRRPKESAGAFVKRHLQYEINGDWGRDWDELHPLHQGVITRSQFVYCREGELRYRGNETVRVEETYDNPIDVPGIPPARIMGASVEIHSPGQTGGTFTDHAVKVEGGWRWILYHNEVDAYARGECLDGTKLPNASG